MKWQECFEKYEFRSLIRTVKDGQRTTEIGEFMRDGEVPKELCEIYLSRYRDEMFLVLRFDKGTDISEGCSCWDKKILSFLNFGGLHEDKRELLKNIKYNVTQIVLCEEVADFRLEKSVSVSRKILLRCNGEDELDDGNRLRLPFWYDEFKGAGEDKERIEQLNILLPQKDELAFLRQQREKIDRRRANVSETQTNFDEAQLELVKGWLEG